MFQKAAEIKQMDVGLDFLKESGWLYQPSIKLGAAKVHSQPEEVGYTSTLLCLPGKDMVEI